MSSAPYNRDWNELNERITLAWPDPELSGCRRLEDVLLRIRQRPDPVLRILLGRAGNGDRLAGRVIVQALLGKLVRMSSRDSEANLDDYVACLWLVLMSYPLHRPGSVAGGLVLDTLKAVRAERGRPLPPSAQQHLSHGEAGEPDPAEVIHRAERAGLVSPATATLLRAAYLEGRTSAELAESYGISAAAVRQRCSTAFYVASLSTATSLQRELSPSVENPPVDRARSSP